MLLTLETFVHVARTGGPTYYLLFSMMLGAFVIGASVCLGWLFGSFFGYMHGLTHGYILQSKFNKKLRNLDDVLKARK